MQDVISASCRSDKRVLAIRKRDAQPTVLLSPEVILPAREWARQQWGQVDLGDKRLNRRAVEVGSRMAAHPQASLPEQAGTRKRLVGTYRLLNNKRPTMEKLLEPEYKATRRAAEQQAVVLLLHDTTELDYTAHRHTQGLGPIGNGRGQGLLLHSMLAVVPETRQVLGVAHAQVVLREAHAKQRKDHRRSAEAKLWEVATHAMGQPPAGSVWVHVTDRGSDGFEYMTACRAEGTQFVVRAMHNRLLTMPNPAENESRLGLLDWARRMAAQPGSEYEVSVAATAKQSARTAHLVLAWSALTLPPPVKGAVDGVADQALPVWVIRAWEPHPPKGVKPVEWILITSCPVHGLSDAQRIVAWYSCRWLCEDYHQCLKTGCRVEDTQLDHADDIKRFLGFAIPIAVRLLQLRQLVRHSPDEWALKLIDPLLVKIVAHEQDCAADGMTLAEFWLNVAKTGGHQGRRGDGAPGWRTLWAGWRHITDLAQGARLFAAHVA